MCKLWKSYIFFRLLPSKIFLYFLCNSGQVCLFIHNFIYLCVYLYIYFVGLFCTKILITAEGPILYKVSVNLIVGSQDADRIFQFKDCFLCEVNCLLLHSKHRLDIIIWYSTNSDLLLMSTQMKDNF